MEKMDLFRMSEFGLAEELQKSLTTKNINSRGPYGRTCLICASMCNQLRVVELLLKAGADPKVVCSNGWTALDWASKLEQKEVVKVLLTVPIERKDVVVPEPKTLFSAV